MAGREVEMGRKLAEVDPRGTDHTALLLAGSIDDAVHAVLMDLGLLKGC